MIKPTVEVQAERANRVVEIQKAMHEMSHMSVDVGVHEGAGVYDADPSLTVAQVATWMEFGTEGHNGRGACPARPFLRSAIDAKTEQLNKLRADLVGQIIDGNITPKHAIDTLGLRAQVYIQNKISSNVQPALSPKYRRWKVRQGKAPRTLILTGKMLASISYRVNAVAD